MDEEIYTRYAPVYRTSPVADKEEDSDGENVVSGNAVVCVREVNGRYSITVSQGEERCVAE